MHKTAKCFDPIGTVESWVLKPGTLPKGTRKESHFTSQLSVETLIELFRVMVGEPNGLAIKDATPSGLDEGRKSRKIIFGHAERDFAFFIKNTFDVSYDDGECASLLGTSAAATSIPDISPVFS